MWNPKFRDGRDLSSHGSSAKAVIMLSFARSAEAFKEVEEYSENQVYSTN
jgi:hypothetical protein